MTYDLADIRRKLELGCDLGKLTALDILRHVLGVGTGESLLTDCVKLGNTTFCIGVKVSTVQLAFSRAEQHWRDRVDELSKLVYVPGLWRCAKCNFRLMQANLNALDGSVTARDTPGDKCPNCNGPLWRVTERQAGNDLVDRSEAMQEEIATLRARLNADPPEPAMVPVSEALRTDPEAAP